jgi:putative hydrolase of the HAD superfamily
MKSPTPAAIDWQQIDTVLLDLDGTLLDLAYDTFIWLTEVPRLYAANRGLTLAAAQQQLAPKFRAWRGKLEWYCIDFWSRELDLDIAQMHHAAADRIAWLPGAREFLFGLRTRGKRAVLCTNSHPTILAIKDRRAGVLGLMDAGFSSHQFGAPKEDSHFWQALRAVVPFDPARTLFVDDSLPVLAAARRAGVRWLAQVIQPDSSQAPVMAQAVVAEYLTINAVADLR